jgi:hypothetical protein
MAIRGQSALEYLVTYGWAILAIVIIGGVLWYFGVFNPGKFFGASQCTGFTSFNCQGFNMTNTGTATIVLDNIAGGNLVNVTVNGQLASCSPANVATGAATTCTYTYASLAGGSTGQQFPQTQVNVSYQTFLSGLVHQDTGSIQGKYG